MPKRPGPPPKPTALKPLQGNPEHKPLNKNESQPQQGIPSRPQFLSKEAKAEWNRVTAELAELGVLALVDRAALTSYCQAWGDYVEARKLVNDLDCKLQTGTNGIQHVHPYVKMANDAEKRFIALAQEFGLTPSARSRIRVEKPQKKLADFAKSRRAWRVLSKFSKQLISKITNCGRPFTHGILVYCTHMMIPAADNLSLTICTMNDLMATLHQWLQPAKRVADLGYIQTDAVQK